MASNNSGSNRMEVPQAKEAMDRFKMEVASELGVPLKQGYNGDLTSAQNGSVGGEMVRQMIKKQEESMSGTMSANTAASGTMNK
ncbi:MAG: alpha/beta-type small acid-soluble spore protein [Lachnospiraceae bacterium]|nr:alpha/beta-type small acid-soluble spore protein [Lachnospiraceae bacterium]